MRRLRLAVVPLLLIAALLVGACAAPRFANEATSPMAASEAGAAPAAAPDMDRAAMAQTGTDGSVPGASSNALLGRKMVARATIELAVNDVAQAVDSIEALLAEQGGFVSNANLYNETYSYTPDGQANERLRGNLTLRVPVENLEPVLDALEGLAIQVGTRSITREDVTDQYTDLDARLRNLQATEDELREMLAEVRAKPNARPDDILAVHNRLMEIRGQIEQVQGQKNMLDNLIGLSTIEVTLVPDAAALPVVDDSWRPAASVRNATRALVSSLQTLGEAAIWFAIAVVPILLLVLLPFVVLFLIVRAVVRRRRRRAAALAA
jgi:hypothetical protein